MLDPIIYARELTKKMRLLKAEAWLVNTGWMGGPFGTGKRIDLPSTRKIINAILDGSLSGSEFTTIPVFNLSIPLNLKGVGSNLLNPARAWKSEESWNIAANDLARKFLSNFCKFTSNEETSRLVQFGPVYEKKI
jgi:phosphoenolpyruvate carboxykinase (ATP)